jgi:hypothetical protein
MFQIQNDFHNLFPLAADNLFFNWKVIAPKVLHFGSENKKTPSHLGIHEAATTGTFINSKCLLTCLQCTY